MPEITMTRGYTALIDDIDVDLADLAWHTHSHKAYGRRDVRKNGERFRLYMHRIILSRILGRTLESSEEVDHINGKGWDNRRENLRLATRQQNAFNITPRRNKWGYTGVSFDKRIGQFRAKLSKGGKEYGLGYFDTPELAYAAYCKAAQQHFGEFAHSSFAEASHVS